MSSQSVIVTVPNATLSLEQLLTAIRQLDTPARNQVAQALLETALDAKLSALIRRLVEQEPVDDISDEIINAEIQAVRQS